MQHAEKHRANMMLQGCLPQLQNLHSYHLACSSLVRADNLSGVHQQAVPQVTSCKKEERKKDYALQRE